MAENTSRYIIIPEPILMRTIEGEPMRSVVRDKEGKVLTKPVLDEEGKPVLADGKAVTEHVTEPWIYGYHRFVFERLGDAKTGESVENVLIASSLRQSIRELAPGQLWRLPGDEWDYLVQLIKKPTRQRRQDGTELPAWDPVAAINLAPFFHVTLSAATQPPAVLKVAEDQCQPEMQEQQQ